MSMAILIGDQPQHIDYLNQLLVILNHLSASTKDDASIHMTENYTFTKENFQDISCWIQEMIDLLSFVPDTFMDDTDLLVD